MRSKLGFWCTLVVVAQCPYEKGNWCRYLARDESCMVKYLVICVTARLSNDYATVAEHLILDESRFNSKAANHLRHAVSLEASGVMSSDQLHLHRHSGFHCEQWFSQYNALGAHISVGRCTPAEIEIKHATSHPPNVTTAYS